jgi:hypothetical protein
MIDTLKSPWGGEDTLRALARLVALEVSREPLVALLDELLRFVEHLTPEMRCSILIADLSAGVPRCGCRHWQSASNIRPIDVQKPSSGVISLHGLDVNPVVAVIFPGPVGLAVS